MMSAMMTSALLALGMSSGATAQTVVDLAVATDDLSTLVAALTAGGLVETLNGRGPFTVFAPTNAAFDALGRETLEFLLGPANIAELQNVLTYHVKTDRLRAEDLTDGDQLETIQGQDVGVTIIGSRVFLGDGQVQTADCIPLCPAVNSLYPTVPSDHTISRSSYLSLFFSLTILKRRGVGG